MKSAITGEQPIGLFKRVRADEEVGHDPIPGASGQTIRAPRDPGARRRGSPHLGVADGQAVQGGLGRPEVREGADHLRPDHLTDEEGAFIAHSTQCGSGAWTERRVRT